MLSKQQKMELLSCVTSLKKSQDYLVKICNVKASSLGEETHRCLRIFFNEIFLYLFINFVSTIIIFTYV